MAAIRIGLVVAAVGAVAIGGAAWFRAHDRGARRKLLAELVASSQAAESSGHLDRALLDASAALELARREGLEPPPRLGQRRDELSRREAATQLAGLAGLDPGEAIGRALTLRARARGDPALEELRGPIEGALTAARTRKADAALAEAGLALADDRNQDAIRHATEARSLADLLPAEAAQRTRDLSHATARAVAERVGLLIDPPRGRFFLGSPASYEAAIERPVRDALLRLGYVLPPEVREWHSAWDRLAPNRFVIEAVETPFPYLQSAHRATRLQVHLTLLRHGAPQWAVVLNGRTRTPPPTLPAFESGVLATAPRRDPDAERKLYRDALGMVLDRLPTQLRTLAPPGP
jgi:hypothetical protein